VRGPLLGAVPRGRQPRRLAEVGCGLGEADTPEVGSGLGEADTPEVGSGLGEADK